MKIHRNLELHLETTCFRLSHMLAFHDESLDADLHLKVFNPVYILSRVSYFKTIHNKEDVK
jgi:hypothetical protein